MVHNCDNIHQKSDGQPINSKSANCETEIRREPCRKDTPLKFHVRIFLPDFAKGGPRSVTGSTNDPILPVDQTLRAGQTVMVRRGERDAWPMVYVHMESAFAWVVRLAEAKVAPPHHPACFHDPAGTGMARSPEFLSAQPVETQICANQHTM